VNEKQQLADFIIGILILITLGGWIVGGIILYQEMMT